MMKKLILAILLISSPAWAQTKPLPKRATARADNCAPIGRTEDGKLGYSMKCEQLPAPPPAQPQAETREQLAPKTCAAFRKVMPFESQVIHVRWSGEGVWMPLGDLDFGVSYENHTSYPAPGQIILYPGGISETEILLAYGGVHFASKMGQLAGNHFITLTSGLENLATFGKAVLWKGAQKIRFEEV